MILGSQIFTVGLLAFTASFNFLAVGGSTTHEPRCCKITIFATGHEHLKWPAGQLPDGQIRFNGSEHPATFHFCDGKITDSKGRGCIVTEPPTTQIQCDENTAPAEGFSIYGHGELFYRTDPEFFLCPATDTEYNVYVEPEFGQTKCFPVGLKIKGCETGCKETTTVLETTTVTSIATVVSSFTVTQTCSTTKTPPTGTGSQGFTTSTANKTWTWSAPTPCTTGWAKLV